MWTGLKANSEYTAQITPYHGYVNAEIIIKSKSKSAIAHGGDLWLTVLDKSFGRQFRNAPREKDYIAANKWVEEQLKLLSKYGTVIVTKPKALRGIK